MVGSLEHVAVPNVLGVDPLLPKPLHEAWLYILIEKKDREHGRRPAISAVDLRPDVP
jgi:hypothetical protein